MGERAWVKVGTLVNGAYQFQNFTGTQVILSPTFPIHGAPMKAIKATGIINEQGQIQLDRPLLSDSHRRVEIIVLLGEESDIEADAESKETLLADFRQAWHEAMTGQTVPASQIWEGIEHD